MANIYGRSTATFKPYSFEEMLKPALMATEAYEKADAELNALYEDAASKAFNFASQDVKEKAIYDNMMNKLRLASDSLASGDTNSFKTIRDINKEYRQTMLPIQQRMTKRAELAKEQRDIQKANPYIRFDKDYSQASLDDITSSSTYNVYDLSTIYTNAAKDTASLIAGLYRDQVGTPSKIKGTDYYSVVSGYGFTPDEWDEDMQNKESALYKYVQTAKEKATKGITNPTIKQEIELGVEETIRNNIGKFEHKTLQGSTQSRINTDDEFKYIWENDKPIGYREEYIEGQLRMKGYKKDANGKYTIPPAHLNPDGTLKTPAQTFVEEHRLYTSPVYIETDNLRNALIPEEDRRAFVRNWKEIEKGSEIKHIMETTVPITKTVDKKPVTMYPINFDNLPEHSRLRDLINNTVGFNDVAYYKYGYDAENHRLVVIPIDYDVEKTKSTEIKVNNTTPQPTPTPEVPKKPDTSNS